MLTLCSGETWQVAHGRVIRVLEEGDVFGEASLMCEIPQPWSVRTTITTTRLIAISSRSWRALAEKFPEEQRRCQQNILKTFGSVNDPVIHSTVELVKQAIARNDKDQASMMSYAAARGSAAEVQHMLQHFEYPPDRADYDYRTALHLAAAHGHYQVCKLLLDHGANVNVRDRFGYTPLQEAMNNDHIGVAQLLKQSGGLLILNDEAGVIQTSMSVCNAKPQRLSSAQHSLWDDACTRSCAAVRTRQTQHDLGASCSVGQIPTPPTMTGELPFMLHVPRATPISQGCYLYQEPTGMPRIDGGTRH